MNGTEKTFWWFEYAPPATATIAIAVGVLVLVGWIFDLELLKNTFFGLVAMKANTALCFILAGVTLWCAGLSRPVFSSIALLGATLVFSLGLLTLVEYLSGRGLGIDQLLFRNATSLKGDIAGRMAVSTAACMSSLGAALLLFVRNRNPRIVQLFSIWPMLVALSTLLSYAYDLDVFFHARLNYTPMALNTAAMFILLCLGVMNARPEYPLWRIMTSAGAAGRTARLMLPVVVAYPSIVGWLVLKAHHLVHFPDAVALALFAVANIAGLSALVLWNSGNLYEVDLLRQKAEDAVRRDADEIEDLYNRAPVGYHSLDKQGTFIRINDTELSWLGYQRGELIGKKCFSDLLTLQSRRIYLEEYPEYKARGTMSDLELEMRRKNGSVFPVFLSATAVKDDRGDFLMSRSTVYDITDLKRSQEALRESERQTWQLLSQLPTAVVVYQPDLSISYANETASKLLGIELEQLIGKNAYDHGWHFVRNDGSVMPVAEYPANRVFAEKTPLNDCLFGIIHSSQAEPLWVYGNAFPQMGIDRTLREVVMSFVDITARKRAEEELLTLQQRLREEAIRDQLTGLYNRRYLQETLAHELARAMREGYPVGMLMGDIDYFKRFNDEYGHQAGDEVLKALGALLHDHARAGDTPCRYGGEEFLVVLPNAPLAAAIELAERVRRDFLELHIEFEGRMLDATVSIGVAAYPDHGNRTEELIKAADSALYRAKHEGRNRVCAASRNE